VNNFQNAVVSTNIVLRDRILGLAPLKPLQVCVCPLIWIGNWLSSMRGKEEVRIIDTCRAHDSDICCMTGVLQESVMTVLNMKDHVHLRVVTVLASSRLSHYVTGLRDVTLIGTMILKTVTASQSRLMQLKHTRGFGVISSYIFRSPEGEIRYERSLRPDRLQAAQFWRYIASDFV
jgi:hypothetical protein